MRDITHCPNCQTQFFVSEEQLKQHGGLVRCGQCLHVFNAKEQFVVHTAPNHANDTELKQPDSNQPDINEAGTNTPDLSNQSLHTTDISASDTSQFATKDDSADNSLAATQPSTSQPETHIQSSSWPPLEQIAEPTTADTNQLATQPAPPVMEQASTTVESNGQSTVLASSTYSVQAASVNPSTQLADDISPNIITSNQPHYTNHTDVNNTNVNNPDLNDLAKYAKLEGKKSNRRHRWPWALGACLLLCLVIAQSIYFLRNTIAMYYPALKPYLIQACQPLHCSIELPKQIDWIVIDDSDMQEDPDHAGVMRLSSMLYNKAGFVQAYPNLELTLTDTDDNAVLRRIFTPAEYLPADTDISNGFKAGSEIRVKLAITAQEVSVAGYRLYVAY